MQVCIIGTGYVGLTTGTCLAEIGHQVICIDNNEEKIAMLKREEMPIYEPGLEEMVKRNVHKGRLSFSTSIAEGVERSDIIFIAVNTPPRVDGGADLSYVEKVSREVAEVMDSYKVIVDKSTVPVETGEWVAKTIRAYNIHNVEFDVVSNPEFLREGAAIQDAMHPDRIVIGVTSDRAAGIMKELYRPLKAPIIITDIRSAEIIKHASNAFLATKISFINAIANICERVGADVVKVAEGMGYDKRIRSQFLKAGVGYGGSCFPKDVAAFINIAEKYGYDFQLLRVVQQINEGQKQSLIDKINEALWILNDKLIGILGLSFKPNTDDIRNSPAIDIIRYLQEEGARIKAYDPQAMEKVKQIMPEVLYCRDPYEVADRSDALVIITDWEEFKHLDLNRIKSLLRRPVIIDGRNIFEPAEMREMGFEYRGIGR